MGTLERLLIGLGVTLTLIFAGIPLGQKVYQYWGRTLIYSPTSKISQYPGSGKITQKFNEQIFVVPKGLGKPAFDVPENKPNYSVDENDIFTIPTQDQLLYEVGKFQGWEDVAGSKDKYILVKDPSTGLTGKWRVSFEASDLFKDDTTVLWIENDGLKFTGKPTNDLVAPPDPQLVNLGYDYMKGILSKGDAIILVPVFDPPILPRKTRSEITLLPKSSFEESAQILRFGGNLKFICSHRINYPYM